MDIIEEKLSQLSDESLANTLETLADYISAFAHEEVIATLRAGSKRIYKLSVFNCPHCGNKIERQ